MNESGSGTADFAAAADQLRLGGDARAAVRACEAGLVAQPRNERGRIALALALLDLGDLGRARAELAMALAMPSAPGAETARPALVASHSDALGGEIAEDELEHAFAEAETNPEEMLDANRVVEQTLRHVEQDPLETDFDVADHPAYATETMASLLDRQGRRSEADALRQTLARTRASMPPPVPSRDEPEPRAFAASVPAESGVGPDHAKQLRIVATLEGWLYNLKRNAERDGRSRVGAGRARLARGSEGGSSRVGRARTETSARPGGAV